MVAKAGTGQIWGSIPAKLNGNASTYFCETGNALHDEPCLAIIHLTGRHFQLIFSIDMVYEGPFLSFCASLPCTLGNNCVANKPQILYSHPPCFARDLLAPR